MPNGVICGGAVEGSNQLGAIVTCQAMVAGPAGACAAALGVAPRTTTATSSGKMTGAMTPSRVGLHRQLVSVRRGRDLEGVDDPRQEREVVRGRRQLDQPLHTVAALERVEDPLVDAVRAHELPRVGHDIPLVRGKLARVALRPEEVDGLLPPASLAA